MRTRSGHKYTGDGTKESSTGTDKREFKSEVKPKREIKKNETTAPKSAPRVRRMAKEEPNNDQKAIDPKEQTVTKKSDEKQVKRDIKKQETTVPKTSPRLRRLAKEETREESKKETAKTKVKENETKTKETVPKTVRLRRGAKQEAKQEAKEEAPKEEESVNEEEVENKCDEKEVKPKIKKKEILPKVRSRRLAKQDEKEEPNDDKPEEPTEQKTKDAIIDEKPEEIEEIEPIVETEDKINELMETEEQSLKRKSDESEAKEDNIEPSKRQKVSRLSVPSLPQICGQLFSLGNVDEGQTGIRLKRVDEHKIRNYEPSLVTDEDGQVMREVVSVACGAMHTLCLSSDQKLYSFGCNDEGALGRDTSTSDDTEDSVDVDSSEEVVSKIPKPVDDLPAGIARLRAGDSHSCVLLTDGSVYLWGNFRDDSHNLGLFVDSESDSEKTFVSTFRPKRLEIDTKIVDIASGCHHILLLTEDGHVLSFGDGSKGQLGRIERTDLVSVETNRSLFLEPKRIQFPDSALVDAIWAGHWCSYARTTSGEVYAWGLNNYHQLGFESEGTVDIPNADPNSSHAFFRFTLELKPRLSPHLPTNVRQIANGQQHLLVLDSEGQVFVCGSNLYSKLGLKVDENDPIVKTPRSLPTDAFDGHKVTSIACADFNSLAITESGHLYAWGPSGSHIGTDSDDNVERPTRVKGHFVDKTRFVDLAVGAQHTVLIGSALSVNGDKN
ncbi:regulator of chromosome condensation-like [Oppia nitens]|uniref:regulator of chromosome condensation-like n=1 Tax=Oppia nitens TaxID=1686743 RepID=UPI0023DB3E07|nr:regulator of chromosome condensation-like [Oppia nitens]